ncbi:MAG: GGDEF domain-containing protein [Bacteriovoracaceae bacterium]|jgi:diguanylate cyclase (GGDEF)-like protein|nr:GGDEF domain-containing protein [Bacteriovoracaceae bacterium]
MELKRKLQFKFIGFNIDDYKSFKKICENPYVEIDFSYKKSMREFQYLPDTLFFIGHEAIKELSSDFKDLSLYAPVVLFSRDLDNLNFHELFKLNVIDVLNNFPSKQRFLNLLTKASVQLLFDRNVPLRALDHIVKSSIKVKTPELLNDYLSTYLDFFEQTQRLCFVEFSAENQNVIFGRLETEDKKFIRTKRLDKRYIGDYYIYKDKYYVPVSRNDNAYFWLIFKTSKNIEVILSDLLFMHLEKIQLYKSLKNTVQNYADLSNTDEVTGAYNQRKLRYDLEKEIELSFEQQMNFSLMFIDIDHFKNVNDSYGHLVGSSMLIQLSDLLRSLVRTTDSVYRYGGDEFIILMRDTQTQIVHTIAQRILQRVKEYKFKIDTNEDYNLSVSIGIAEYPIDAKTPKEIIFFADQMMYKSKKSGRGKIFHVKEV